MHMKKIEKGECKKFTFFVTLQ